MKSDSSQKFLFSYKAASDLANMVRQIKGRHDHFATHFMTMPVGGEDSAISVRIEAWKNPNTGLWQLDKLTRMQMAGSDAIKKEPVTKPGICFFDALHYCSAFEAAEVAKGKIPLIHAGEQWAKIPHWRTAADSAGQAVDADGLVQPCAYGRPLAEGFFTADAYAIARGSPSLDSTIPAAVSSPADAIIGEILSLW